MNDYSSEGGAEMLCQKIIDYWKEKGREIKAWIVPLTEETGKTYSQSIYCIRSNMKDGLPR